MLDVQNKRLSIGGKSRIISIHQCPRFVVPVGAADRIIIKMIIVRASAPIIIKSPSNYRKYQGSIRNHNELSRTTRDFKLVDFDKVYDILVEEAGASEDERDSFLLNHPPSSTPSEWRFRGKLGFGGKFRCDQYRESPCFVDYYPEDSSIVRDMIQLKVNLLLKAFYVGSVFTLSRTT